MFLLMFIFFRILIGRLKADFSIFGLKRQAN